MTKAEKLSELVGIPVEYINEIDEGMWDILIELKKEKQVIGMAIWRLSTHISFLYIHLSFTKQTKIVECFIGKVMVRKAVKNILITFLNGRLHCRLEKRNV